MTIFLMFFIELMAARFDVFGEQEHDIERAGPSIHPIKKREKYSDSSTQGQSGK
jgi:zinc transporter 1/2/3